MSKHINWINFLKAICIIGVFYRHTENYFGYQLGLLHIFILPFYVNAFFFISGYLLFRKQLSEPLIGRKVADYVGGGGGGINL